MFTIPPEGEGDGGSPFLEVNLKESFSNFSQLLGKNTREIGLNKEEFYLMTKNSIPRIV